MPSTRAQREGERPEHYINDILQYCEMPVIGRIILHHNFVLKMLSLLS